MIAYELITAFKMMLRVAIVALVLVVLGLSGIAVFGIPEVLKDRVIQGFQDQSGIMFDANQVLYRPWGWVLSDVVIYDQNPDQLDPIFKADRLVLDNHFPLKRWEKGLSNKIVFSSIQILKNAVGLSNTSTSWLMVENIQFELSREENRFFFSEGSYIDRFADLNFAGDIEITGTLGGEVLDMPNKKDSENHTDQSMSLADIIPLITCSEVARGEILFSAKINDLNLSGLQVWVDLSGFRCAGIECDELQGKFEYSNQTVNVNSLSFYSEDKMINLSGMYNWSDRVIALQVDGTLDLSELDLPLVEELQEFVMQSGFSRATISTFSVNVTSGSVDSVVHRISGNTQVLTESINGLLVEPIDFTFSGSTLGWRMDAPRITLIDTVSNKQAELGIGWLKDDGNKFLSLDVRTPATLLDQLPFVDQSLKNILTRFKGASSNSFLESKIEGAWIGVKKPVWTCSVEARDINYHDVYFSELNADFSCSNNRVVFDRLLGQRDEIELLKGTFEIDFINKYFSGELTSGLALQDIEDVIGFENTIFHDSLDVSGRSQVTFKGGVSYESFCDAEFSVFVSSEKFCYGDKILNQVDSKWKGRKNRLELSHLTGDFLGGNFSSEGVIIFDNGSEHGWFDGRVGLHKVPINQIMETGIEAILNIDGLLRFDTRSNVSESCEGRFAVDLEGEQLAELPILNDLSSILGSVWQPLDIFSINRMSGDIYCAKHRFETDNLIFSGNFFEGCLKGAYSVDVGYDAVLRIQLNESSDVRKVLRILTKPFFRILDLNLSGDSSSPEWSLRRIDEIVR